MASQLHCHDGLQHPVYLKNQRLRHSSEEALGKHPDLYNKIPKANYFTKERGLFLLQLRGMKVQDEVAPIFSLGGPCWKGHYSGKRTCRRARDRSRSRSPGMLQVCVALNLMVIPLPQPSECKSCRYEPPHSCPQSLVLAALALEDEH